MRGEIVKHPTTLAPKNGYPKLILQNLQHGFQIFQIILLKESKTKKKKQLKNENIYKGGLDLSTTLRAYILDGRD